MAARQAGSTDAIQIQETGTNFFGLKNSIGQFGHTMVQTIVYKMRGFNPSTQQFEHWETFNPNVLSHTGNVLTNVVIAAVLSDEFPPIA